MNSYSPLSRLRLLGYLYILSHLLIWICREGSLLLLLRCLCYCTLLLCWCLVLYRLLPWSDLILYCCLLTRDYTMNSYYHLSRLRSLDYLYILCRRLIWICRGGSLLLLLRCLCYCTLLLCWCLVLYTLWLWSDLILYYCLPKRDYTMNNYYHLSRLRLPVSHCILCLLLIWILLVVPHPMKLK